jgi:hypothetical protein
MSEASKMTLNWIQESLSDMWEKKIWPPSSSDCEPLDCFMCGVSEFGVNVKPHNKTAYLIPKIMEVIESLDRDTVVKTFRRFRSSSEACIIGLRT